MKLSTVVACSLSALAASLLWLAWEASQAYHNPPQFGCEIERTIGRFMVSERELNGTGLVKMKRGHRVFYFNRNQIVSCERLAIEVAEND